MLTVRPDLGYARLQIGRDQDFTEVAEAIRTLFHVCCLNSHLGALIVSAQTGLDWRSCMRLGIRIGASRKALPGSGLALVVGPADPRLRKDVADVAEEAGIACRIFEQEADAVAWLTSFRGA